MSKLGVKFFSMLLVVSLFIFLGAGFSFAAQLSDIRGHWAEKQISGWADRGLATGYQDGSFKPDNSITRAEFITLVNKSFGFSGSAGISYTDVSSTDWFFEQVRTAGAAGYISGYEDGTLRPGNEISRQEVAVILSRLMKLKVPESMNAVKKFKDGENIPQWSKGPVNAVVAGGYMAGYPDQTYQPERAITRAEAIVTLDRAMDTSAKTNIFDKAGTFGPEQGLNTIDGDVVISAAGVTLQHTAINGNLVLAEGIGEGNAYFKNVTVKGSTTINGGGGNSDEFEDCTLGAVTVNKKEGNVVRIVLKGKTSASDTKLESGARLEESGLTGDGFGNITIAGTFPAGSTIVLAGVFKTVTMQSPNASVQVENGSVTSINVAEGASGTTIGVAGDAKVTTLTLNAAAKVTGQGAIETALIKTNGSIFDQTPKNVILANGISATVNGKEVTQSTTVTNPAGAGGAGGGSPAGNDTSAPKITAATVTVGGSGQQIVVNSDGLNGTVDLSGLDKASSITEGTISVSEASTLTLTVRGIPITQQLTSGTNQLDAINILSQFGKNGMNLEQLKQLLGSPAVLSGTLKDSSNNSSSVSITIILP